MTACHRRPARLGSALLDAVIILGLALVIGVCVLAMVAILTGLVSL